MEREVKKQKRILAALLFCIFTGMLLLLINVKIFNSQKRSLYFGVNDSDSEYSNADVKVLIAPRGGSTDAWVKKIAVVNESGIMQEFQYSGIIYDIMLLNQSSTKVENWSLKVNIPQECFLNNAWCGRLEIHQNVSEEEICQTLDLRKCIEKKTDILLNHTVDGADLLIPVKEGDYFVYLPSAEDKEDIISPKDMVSGFESSKRVDFIAYHKITDINTKAMEFAEIELTYYLKKDMFGLPAFWILLLLFLVWCISVLIILLVNMKMKKLIKQQNRDEQIIEQSMRAFMGFIDAKDTSTNGHSLRVAQYSRLLAQRIGFSKEECQRVYYIGLMHDCGKIGIPESILKKPDKLSAQEYEIMKTHTVLGEKILQEFTSIEGIREGVRYHHERYDGQGYPDGLKGEEIPLIARIICIADSFDAMNSIRCYPNHLSHEEIISQLKDNSGTQFDAKLVDYFLEMLTDGTILF